MINTLRASPSQQAAQELECLKQAIDWKVEDIEAGYYILLGRLNTAVETTINRHATISQGTVEALGSAPAAAPACTGGDQVKLKEGLKPSILTLDFNPQEFQAWQNKFRFYYRTSRMNTADAEYRPISCTF